MMTTTTTARAGESEYRTVNLDLAAALITTGTRLQRLDTSDGVTIEFVFESTLLDGQGTEHPVPNIVEDWSRNRLWVDASTMSKNIKRIQKQVRDRKRGWSNSRTQDTDGYLQWEPSPTGPSNGHLGYLRAYEGKHASR